MALKTARFDVAATVEIDRSLCKGCGACARVCRGAPLHMEGETVHVDQRRGWGCMACGQCVAVCPNGAIRVTGRDLSADDVVPMPSVEARAGFEELRALLLARRSVRDFARREVEPDVIERILDAASSAPMGLPPSDVRALVFAGRDKVKGFRDALLQELRSWKWMSTWWGSAAMRPFVGKATTEVMRGFVREVIEVYEQKDREGQDWFFYDAPLAIYFHASPYADPADPVVAATYAMIAGHSLGLGSTMLGFPGMIMKHSRGLKRRFGVDPEAEAGLAVIFGHPAVRYHRALRRRLGEIRYWTGEEVA
jgi:ferredoxin